MQKLIALFMMLLIAAPTLAQDQPVKIDNEKIRWTLAAKQIRVSLESANEAIVTQTLKNAIVLATLYRDKIDMTKHVRDLRSVYEKSESANHRALALAALQAIGGFRAYDFVSRNATNAEFEEGRMIVASVLNDYYTNRRAS